MTDLIPFDYEGRKVRVHTDHEGNPWWIAKDICDVLALDNVSKATRRLPADEKGITEEHTLGGRQQLLTVNEPGLYRLIFRSNKGAAEKFRRWVFHDVLPTLRKTGKYAVATSLAESPPPTLDVPALITSVTTALVPAMVTAMTQVLTPVLAVVQEQSKALQQVCTLLLGSSPADTQHTSYITIEGWCRIRDVKMSFSDKQTFGKRATAFCKEQGIRRGTVPDERYGKVGSYPIEVLDDLWHLDQDAKDLWKA